MKSFNDFWFLVCSLNVVLSSFMFFYTFYRIVIMHCVVFKFYLFYICMITFCVCLCYT